MFLPLHTTRVTLRSFTPADTAVFAAYRNDPEVARYQDWDLPVTEAGALEFVTAQQTVAGPVPGDWVQIAVEYDGELAGDVAVGLDPAGNQATIGYTLRADRQRLGIGREAVSALVDVLLDQLDVHRVMATLDPRNTGSARLLEQLGFRYEGCAKAAAAVRGGWEDDDRYALLREDREAWLARPLGHPDEVALVEIDPSNVGAVARLATHRTQERFVAPMAGSFQDALVPELVDGVPAVPWMRAVAADDELAGFVMLAEVTPTMPEPYLWRLLIDRRHQRRGIGARVVELVVRHLREQGHQVLKTSWVDAPDGPEPFYRCLGFGPTGELDDDEIVATLRL